jgi:hypothetical protein
VKKYIVRSKECKIEGIEDRRKEGGTTVAGNITLIV